MTIAEFQALGPMDIFVMFSWLWAIILGIIVKLIVAATLGK